MQKIMRIVSNIEGEIDLALQIRIGMLWVQKCRR